MATQRDEKAIQRAVRKRKRVSARRARQEQADLQVLTDSATWVAWYQS